MIPAETSLRLFLALILAVYGYLVGLAKPVWGRRVTAALVGAVPFAVWLAAPGAVEAGDIALGMAVRRAALAAGAVAVGLRYASVRAHDRPQHTMSAFAAASAAVLFVTIGAGTGNWLVTAAFAVTAIAVAGISSSGASGDAARTPPRDQRGD